MNETMLKSGDKGDRSRFSRTIPPAPLKLNQLAFEDGNAVLRRQGVPSLLYAKLGLPTSPQTIPVRVITSVLPMVEAGGKSKRAVRDVCPERLFCLVYVTAHALLRCASSLPPKPRGEAFWVDPRGPA
ncbi:hypothetical protein [Paenibacillus lautus]|uniref:hypothetical protein n=1 Tax=Paenibacillus lautus TaxID=1401 RepID=UPI000FD6D436|nr:hypothetical protein [Paenibacillus lautus]